MSEPQFVEGWANGGHCLGVLDNNSVMIAPDATPNGLVSWAVGQVQQLNVLLSIIGCSSGTGIDFEPATVCNAIRHQLQQIEGVLVGASDLLVEASRGEQS